MQTTTDTSNTSNADSGFHAAPTGGETQSGSHLLIEAYAAIWLCLLVFVLVLWRRTLDLEGRIAVLREAISRAAKKPAAALPDAKKRVTSAPLPPGGPGPSPERADS